jgi:hypothetical protein
MKNANILNTTIVLSSALFIFSCEVKLQKAAENIQQTESLSSLGNLKVDVNMYSSAKLVCDPLAPPTGPSETYEYGIKASLYYLEAGMPRLYKATDYVQFGRKADSDVFLRDMNVPTRMFTEGFSTPTGQTLAKDNGEKLIEYFGLKMNSSLMLNEADEEGEYELAMLADDGSNLTIKANDDVAVDKLLISNDGDHPTRMGCATQTVHFSKNVMVPIEVSYYQGPMYHISNVLIWRKSNTAGSDPLCGQTGNNLFFNPNDNSKPLQAFKDLQARGWKIVKPNNFILSKTNSDYNPCVVGTNPVITNFLRGELGATTVYLSWTTDIPATTQVQLTNVATGVITTTISTNQLYTSHEAQLQGLKPGEIYKVRAVSVSGDLGRSLSEEITFTTQAQ